MARETLTWHYVKKWADERPDKEALIFGEKRVTFKEFYDTTPEDGKAPPLAGGETGGPRLYPVGRAGRVALPLHGRGDDRGDLVRTESPLYDRTSSSTRWRTQHPRSASWCARTISSRRITGKTWPPSKRQTPASSTWWSSASPGKGRSRGKRRSKRTAPSSTRS